MIRHQFTFDISTSLESERGVSELAQILLIMMVSLIALLTAGAVLKNEGVDILNQSRFQVSLKIVGSQFISAFRHEDALADVYAHSENSASIATLKSCREGASCEHDKTGDLAVLFNAKGDIIYNKDQPNQGFNHNGEPCTYNPSDPDSAFACPIYVNMFRWLARCPKDTGGATPATCVAPNIYLQVSFAVRQNVVSEMKVRLNPYNTMASAQPTVLP